MSKHTPGPWKITAGNCIESEDSCELARVEAQSAGDDDDANAHLIAAAPELLEALKAIFADNCFYHKPGDERAYRLSMAAIAKATGVKP